MSDLVGEILLRLAKVGLAAVLAVLVFMIALALGAGGSVELALLCWLSAAVFVLVVQDSPI